ncbi:MAG: aminoacetone oxidase family FAD-binding enzyme [Prevotella sp.]
MHIAIIGGGAAGCFAAISLSRICRHADITVYESGNRPLAKVAVTGGGRCNLTNSFEHVKSTAAVYPRGERLMKRLLREFGNKEVCGWFENEGVRLVTQDDGCVFPRSQDAMEIVNTLTRLMDRGGVRVETRHRVSRIRRDESDGRYRIAFADDNMTDATADMVLVTTGGSKRRGPLDTLVGTEIETVEPVPSLFSVCIPEDNITELTGTVVERVTASLAGTKWKAEGALLITHKGMSGPAILKLSSYAARALHDCGYKATLNINWLGTDNEEKAGAMLANMAAKNMRKMVSTVCPPQLNARLWNCLLMRWGVNTTLRWAEIGKKGINRMVNGLTNSTFRIDGKNNFKEEFVTCGGVALTAINPNTLESRTSPGLYFAGEVLDVDAVTGGFNLQAAWTMAHVAAKAMAEKASAFENMGGKRIGCLQ